MSFNIFSFADGSVELDVAFGTYKTVQPAMRLFNFGCL